MLEKKYYDGMQIHDVLCECLDDYDTILTILQKFASLPSAIDADRKDESISEKPNNSTISKMEQVEDEPQIGEMMTEEEFDSMLARVLTGKDEPQTEIKGSKRLLKGSDEPKTCEDCKHNGEKHAYDYACDKCTDMDKFQHEDEPQTDCAWR